MAEINLAEVFELLGRAHHSISDGPTVDLRVKAGLRNAALELIAALSTPYEAAMGFTPQNAVPPCYRVAADCGVFTSFTKETKSTKELSKATRANIRLVVRIMRVFTSSAVFKEVGEELYSHNGLSSALSKPGFLSTARFTSPAIARLPEYLSATSYQNNGLKPETTLPFQYGNNTPLSFYQALGADPKARVGFDSQMKAHVAMEQMKFRTGFTSIFNLRGKLDRSFSLPRMWRLSKANFETYSVGGSLGHVLEDIVTQLPGLKGRLILEDLPKTLESTTGPKGIEVIPYDFLEGEQPIKGAACYLFRQIVLNWSDARGFQILRKTKASMKPGHSRVLIMEPVIPPVSAPLPAALFDIQMAQMGGGLRAEKRWRIFLAEASFEVRRFLPSNSTQTITEAFAAS